MDKYNVIIPTSDLTELENDMVKWANMPYNFRLRSDEECIRRYNMTNIDLFNRIKAMINNRIFPKEPELIGKMISESADILSSDEEFFSSTYNDEEFLWKMQMASQLEESPNVVIISPFKDIDNEYSIDELNEKYNKYILLTPKNKRFSNSYSINLWGYDVPNMYSIMQRKIATIENQNNNDINIIVSKSDSVMNPVVNYVSEALLYGDKLSILKAKLDSLDESVKPFHKAQYDNITKSISEVDYSSYLPKVVPYFTIDEMNDMGLYINEASNIDPENYYSTVSELMYEYEASKDPVLESRIISLGWNPSVPLNEKNLQFARERQSKWLQEKGANIVDLSRLPMSESFVLESSSQMNKLYKEKDLYPIYIVLSYTNTIFGKGIRFIKHSKYTHAGLALDSNLASIATFKFNDEWRGFSNDSLDEYIDADKKSLLMELCIFVDKNTKIKIDAVIRDFIEKQERTVYGFGNLFKILINKSSDNDVENLYLVCSQFVDTVLKLANIDITNKSSNLVIPQDFAAVDNPKVFKLFEGLAKDYNEKEIENKIYSLFQTMNPESIKYSQIMESFNDILSIAFEQTSDNPKVNEILKEMNELITPASILMEKKFPIGMNNDGDLIIKLYKSLEEEYQEAHRLLKQYGNNNIEGVKHELARLFYINTAIEKKIKKMEKSDENYKKFVDLRARVLNDFKKYFKIVLDVEPDFDFSEYFQKSEYYNGNIIIDNALLKFTGNLIKKFLKSLGL